jgi:hypothetical protein
VDLHGLDEASQMWVQDQRNQMLGGVVVDPLALPIAIGSSIAGYASDLAAYSYDYGQGAVAAASDILNPYQHGGLSPNVFLTGGAGDGYQAVAGVARDPRPFIVGAGLSAVPVGRAAALAGGAAAKILPSLSNAANKLSNWARNLFRQKCPPQVPAPNRGVIPRNAAKFEIETHGGILTRDGRVLQNGTIKSRTDFVDGTAIRRVDFDHNHGNLGAPPRQ